METEQNSQRIKVEKNLKIARREKITGIVKTVGYSTVPILVFGGTGVLGALTKAQFENKDLGNLVMVGLSAGLGFGIGISGMISDYVEKFRDYVEDIRSSSYRASEYRRQLQEMR